MVTDRENVELAQREAAQEYKKDSRMAMKLEHRCQDLEAKLKIAIEGLEVLSVTEKMSSDKDWTPKFVDEICHEALQRIRE